MYATISALSRDELAKVVAMRRARPLGSCAAAQAKAREELAKVKLDNWPEVAMANVNAMIRAGGASTDTLSMATLMTATEELVLALLAYGKIPKGDFELLVEPVAHVALPWVKELDGSAQAYERIKEELNEALQVREAQAPTVKARAVETAASGRRARPGQPIRKVAGINVDKLAKKLAETEDEDMARWIKEMQEGGAEASKTAEEAAEPVEAPISQAEPKPAYTAATAAIGTPPHTAEQLEALIDRAIEADDQEMLEMLSAELDVVLAAGIVEKPSEGKAISEGHPETMPEVQPTPGREPESEPIKEGDLDAGGLNIEFAL